jgi:hypothetical protein
MQVAQRTHRTSRREKPAPEDRPHALWPLLAMMGILSIGGFIGGISFVADPTGDAIGARLSWLDQTPVSNFLLPGLFLLVVYGLVPWLLMCGLVWRFSPGFLRRVNGRIGYQWSWAGTIAVGSVLMIWIVYEFTVLPERMVLQPILLAVGALMVAIPLLPSMRRSCSAAKKR